MKEWNFIFVDQCNYPKNTIRSVHSQCIYSKTRKKLKKQIYEIADKIKYVNKHNIYFNLLSKILYVKNNLMNFIKEKPKSKLNTNK